MCSWDDRALDCWFTNYLPDVNWTNMAVADQMLDDAMWWLTRPTPTASASTP
jgi:glycosidase